MLSKVRNVLGYLFPQKQTDIEKKFIELNRKFWRKENLNKESTSNYILVEGQIICPASIIDKARIAKAIEEVTGYRSVVYLRGFYEKANSTSQIYRSFNINKFYMWWSGYLNPTIVLPALYATVHTMVTCKDGKQLIDLVYKNIEIGDLIYDTLIRYKPNTYTIRKINFSHFRLIFRAFLAFHNNEYMIKKFRPRYLVTSHNVYAEFGLLPRQIKKHRKSVIFLKDIYAYKCYGVDANIKEHFLKPSLAEFQRNLASANFIVNAKAYFFSRFEGSVDQIDVKNAFVGKKKYDFDELKEKYPNLSKGKKNVVVMSHAFSDAPHVGEGLLFSDYYDFLEQTLRYLNSCDSINCFVKPHPSSYMWNEKGGVEEMIERNRFGNIYITPSDFNTNSIADFADCIVTAKGTAGLEFSCLGIPAITAGRGYYSGFGITSEPNTKEEYFELLGKCHLLGKLDEQIINKAVVLLYMVSLSRRHSDILPAQHIMPNENYADVFESKFAEVVGNIEAGKEMKDSFYNEVKAHAIQNYV
ncbi:hypothetical protein [Trabulsiella odontotermitis]|uniref:capsular polysaccharide export protein, LipB/KpsS family n=1 Tax=Trabulsiella odontotermitis TaxID=379893 RepID=UPI000675D0FB|nr:hypothetical protein [Trabulsiella odontotermitis]KNC91474.1 hypothetical protein GM30_22520 [Trabulsiella odontotermitis]